MGRILGATCDRRGLSSALIGRSIPLVWVERAGAAAGFDFCVCGSACTMEVVDLLAEAVPITDCIFCVKRVAQCRATATALRIIGLAEGSDSMAARRGI